MDYRYRTVLPRINNVLKTDEQFMSLYRSSTKAEYIFETIMEKLSNEEKEQVGDYIALCEDMEYRKAQIAYQTGVVDGSTGRKNLNRLLEP